MEFPDCVSVSIGFTRDFVRFKCNSCNALSSRFGIIFSFGYIHLAFTMNYYVLDIGKCD